MIFYISFECTLNTVYNNVYYFLQIYLADYNAKHAQFRIMPRFKVKAEGDMVQVEDQIVFESVKSPGQFLHVSKAQFGQTSVYKGE